MKARWGLSSQTSVVALLTSTAVSPRFFKEAYPIYVIAIDPPHVKVVHSPPRVRFIGTFVHLRQSAQSFPSAEQCKHSANLSSERRSHLGEDEPCAEQSDQF
ncbi:hypothetical protein U1Q18_014002 [Sarracenia purpurea var. burkii]